MTFGIVRLQMQIGPLEEEALGADVRPVGGRVGPPP